MLTFAKEGLERLRAIVRAAQTGVEDELVERLASACQRNGGMGMTVHPTNSDVRDEHEIDNEPMVRPSHDLKIRIPLPLFPCHADLRQRGPRTPPSYCPSGSNRC